ncbi:MAG: hypothetical protein KC492_09070 [Myxococcales bacterium]|nr:hypothetical protein [Myxococcales bacterium]
MRRFIPAAFALGLLVACGGSHHEPSAEAATATKRPAAFANQAPPQDPAESQSFARILDKVELPTESPEALDELDVPTLRYTLDPKCKGELAVFEGLYVHQFEVSDFAPNETDSTTYWVSGTKDAMDRLHSSAAGAVKVRGKLSAKGHHGHLGAYERALYVCEVLMYEPLCKTPKGPKLCALVPSKSE